MMKQNEKKELKKFWEFIKKNKIRKTNFCLILALFSILPIKNFYTDLKIPESKPVYRQLDIHFPEISVYPLNTTGKKAPQLTALSYIVVDVNSKTVISSKNPDQKLSPASTTKIMTALVALDHFQEQQVIEIKKPRKIGQIIELEEGEKVTFQNLLYGLLVQSGNDVAFAIAENYPGGEKEFVAEMNRKAKQFNLDKTHFTNPAGLDNEKHYTTTHDLAVLAAEALKNETFAETVATEEIIITDVSGEIEHQLENTNELLGKVKGLKGIKTGWTANAGECLLSVTEREKRRIITAILGSADRFGETKKLIDWVFNNYQWEKL